MLGAFTKVTGLVNLDSILKAVGERFKGNIGERNMEAVVKAYNMTTIILG